MTEAEYSGEKDSQLMQVDPDYHTKLDDLRRRLGWGLPGRSKRDMPDFTRANSERQQFFDRSACEYQQNPPEDYKRLPGGVSLIVPYVDQVLEADGYPNGGVSASLGTVGETFKYPHAALVGEKYDQDYPPLQEYLANHPGYQ